MWQFLITTTNSIGVVWYKWKATVVSVRRDSVCDSFWGVSDIVSLHVPGITQSSGLKQWIVSWCLGTPAIKGDRAHWRTEFLGVVCWAYFFHQRPLHFSILLPYKFPECFLPLFPLCHASLPCPCRGLSLDIMPCPFPPQQGYVSLSPMVPGLSAASFLLFPMPLFFLSIGFVIACLVPVPPFTHTLQ